MQQAQQTMQTGGAPIQNNNAMSTHTSGLNFEMEEIDLSQYGGVKPDFSIKERDDEKFIEEMNSKLFNIQKGGEIEKIEKSGYYFNVASFNLIKKEK